jgi:hypothetical protein
MRQFIGKFREIRHPTTWFIIGKQHPVAEDVVFIRSGIKGSSKQDMKSKTAPDKVTFLTSTLASN